MTSRHLVHPELSEFLDQYPTLEMTAGRLAFLRDSRPAVEIRSTKEVEVEECYINSDAADQLVRVIVFRPVAEKLPLPAVVHIHGGGYLLGKPEDNIQENIGLALACGCVVVSIDYRLSPEFPYPAALDDCYSVLAWLHDNAAQMKIDKERIAVKGESAGGGLAACLALRARDKGLYSVALLILIAPMLEFRINQIKRASNPFTGEFIWTESSNAFAWKAYLGRLHGQVEIPVYAAAGNADILDGLPPTFLAVGALDLFLEEDVDFALRLSQAGVSTEIHVYAGAYHSFQRAGDTSLLKRLHQDYRAAINDAFLRAIPTATVEEIL